jgi:hypothetical protein
MQSLSIALLIGAVVTLAAVAMRKRRPEPPTQSRSGPPQQLDRNDFPRPHASWLAAVFVSDTCHTCADVVPKVMLLESAEVAVTVASYQEHRAIHDRYQIDSVPTTVLADHTGEVHKAFVGPVSATDLWAAMAELREPGSTPPPEAHTPRR